MTIFFCVWCSNSTCQAFNTVFAEPFAEKTKNWLRSKHGTEKRTKYHFPVPISSGSVLLSSVLSKMISEPNQPELDRNQKLK